MIKGTKRDVSSLAGDLEQEAIGCARLLVCVKLPRDAKSASPASISAGRVPLVEATGFPLGPARVVRHIEQQRPRELLVCGDGLETELRDALPTWRLAPVVAGLQALRGVQWLVALTVAAELGDLTRFDTPRQLAAFVGLIPSEYSSGASRRQGGITKAVNGRARRALVEAAWAYRHPAKVSAHIQTRIDALPRALQDIGWKAQLRLCKRFRRLVARGKHPNVAITAIARELLAFMWAIAREVPLAS